MSKVKIKTPLGKQVKELRQQMEILRKQFQQFNVKMIENSRFFEERTMTAWEYLWATIEALREDADFDWLTDQRIDEMRKVVLGRWKEQALEQLKKDLEPGGAVCERCHHKGGGPSFFPEDSETSKCPNCKSEGTAFLKETDVEKSE